MSTIDQANQIKYYFIVRPKVDQIWPTLSAAHRNN